MLFARLEEAKVELPDYDTQKTVSLVLAQTQREITAMKAAIAVQLYDLQQLPHRIVSESVNGGK